MVMCFRDRTFCTAACGCRACTIRMSDAIAEQARLWGQRGGHPPLVSRADRSAGCSDFTPSVDPQ